MLYLKVLFLILSLSIQPAIACKKLAKKIELIQQSRKAMLRKAKRDLGIPNNKKPYKVKNEPLLENGTQKIVNGKPVMTREYFFERKVKNSKGETVIEKIVVQEHTAGHKFVKNGKETIVKPHFNIRPTDELGNTIPKGKIPGTDGHYWVDIGQ
jgi:hypothetical protein